MVSVWAPVLAAAVAVAGTLGAAVVTQVLTGRRDDRRREEDRQEKRQAQEREDRFRIVDERRSTFIQYLKSLHDGTEGIRAVVLDRDASVEGRITAVGAAFRNAGIYAAREELVLVATAELAEAARTAFYRARDLRELAASGISAEHADYQAGLVAYRASLSELRAEMRRDLGIPALPDWRRAGYDL
jgi:hypothetical protein